MQWLFKDFFVMIAVGLIIVTVLAVIMVRMIRYLVYSFANGEYQEFHRNPNNYVPGERPTANYGGGAFSMKAVNARAEQFTKLGGLWGNVTIMCVALMAGGMLLAIHQASQRLDPWGALSLYLPTIASFFFLAIACMVPQKICFTMALWYETAASRGRIHPPPGSDWDCSTGFPVR